MKLDLTGIGIDVTEGIREYAEKKIKKLDKFFKEETIAHVTFSAKKEKQYVDIRIEERGKTFMAEEATHDVYAGIDKLIDKILGQVRKQKTIYLKKRTCKSKTEAEEEVAEDIE